MYTHLNPTDLLSKPLAAGEKRSGFVTMRNFIYLEQ